MTGDGDEVEDGKACDEAMVAVDRVMKKSVITSNTSGGDLDGRKDARLFLLLFNRKLMDEMDTGIIFWCWLLLL